MTFFRFFTLFHLRKKNAKDICLGSCCSSFCRLRRDEDQQCEGGLDGHLLDKQLKLHLSHIWDSSHIEQCFLEDVQTTENVVRKNIIY